MEVRDLASALVAHDAEYWRQLRRRARRGELGPLEVRLWEYAFGKPATADAYTGAQVRVVISRLVAAFLRHTEDPVARRAVALEVQQLVVELQADGEGAVRAALAAPAPPALPSPFVPQPAAPQPPDEGYL